MSDPTLNGDNRPGALSGLRTRLGILGELFSFLWDWLMIGSFLVGKNAKKRG